MISHLVLIFYGGISFITGLAITFNTFSFFLDEDILFKNCKNAIATFAVGIVAGFVFTVISIKAVLFFQNMMA